MSFQEVLTVASNLLMDISQDENERAIFHSRKKAQMDYASNIATAEDRGRNEGKAEERLAIATKLLNLGVSTDKIIAAIDLTAEEVEGLRGVV